MARVAVDLECETVQVFSRSPRGGQPRPLAEDERDGMRRRLDAAGINPLIVHVPYFVNLASPDQHIREYSEETVALDRERARILGADYVVTHPGSYGREGTQAEGIARVGLGIRRLLAAGGSGPKLLLEQTAGGGGQLGGTLRELKIMLDESGAGGICLDTAHAYAAGYDLSDGGWEDFLAEVAGEVGIDRVKVVHLNDTAEELGGHRDRHVRVGEGRLGESTFRRILHDQRLQALPGVLEAPRASDSDLRGQLATLRRLRRD
ncbi:MAG TPA: endonuclease [Clostridiales bacterium]|nr:endonuclease [Clostridiales bacterium]